MDCCTKLAPQPTWQQVLKPLTVAKFLRDAQAHIARLHVNTGRQSHADNVAVPPWLPCSRRRCVHQVTDGMLPQVLIPKCCLLLAEAPGRMVHCTLCCSF